MRGAGHFAGDQLILMKKLGFDL